VKLKKRNDNISETLTYFTYFQQFFRHGEAQLQKMGELRLNFTKSNKKYALLNFSEKKYTFFNSSNFAMVKLGDGRVFAFGKNNLGQLALGFVSGSTEVKAVAQEVTAVYILLYTICIYLSIYIYIYCICMYVRMYHTYYVLIKPRMPYIASSPLCLLRGFASCLNFGS